MRVGVMLEERGGLPDLARAVSAVAAAGFDTAWFPQLMGVDILTAIAVVGAGQPAGERRIELGTAVVATYPRHPVVMAQQAITTQAAVEGRLTLGLGVSHRFVIEGMLGMSFERPATHLREHLGVLLPLLRESTVDVTGTTLSARVELTARAAPPPSVLLAAMGPVLLGLAGRAADGTITWMTGPRTLADHVVPRITAAALADGRPAPRVVAGLPVCVTHDIDGARGRIAEEFAIYGRVPSYRAMLDREGAAGPADVAIVGDEDDVADAIAALAAMGVTDLLVAETGRADERARTRAAVRAAVPVAP